MIYPIDFEQKLGFDVIRHELGKRCTIPSSGEKVSDLHISTDIREIAENIKKAEQMRQAMVFDTDFNLPPRADCSSVIKIGNPGLFLTAEECYNLYISINCFLYLQKFFEDRPEKYPTLKKITDSTIIPIDISHRISKILDTKTGEIRDDASTTLSGIRKTIKSKRKNTSVKLQQVLSIAKENGYTDENAEISIRDGHSVIPVNSSCKRKLPGFIMGNSASGKTSFIEPIEIVELTNEIAVLEDEEIEEINRILTEFTDYLSPYKSEIIELSQKIGEIDFICAKAQIAIDMNAGEVIVESTPTINLREARHPLLEKSLKVDRREIVPLSLTLNEKNRILLVSGPNAGGKSVCLKTVGLLQYMFQCGLLIPALPNSELTVFDNIMLDIGDQQSIDNDLSTYSSHLKNMKVFLKNASQKTLFLIDEFGGGTEPTAGGAIAEAVLEKLIESQAFGVITTHYSNLKHFAMNMDGIQNGAMTFDQGKIAPLFRLIQGEPGSSFAFEIAHNIGLPQDVIEKAKGKIAPEHIALEKLLKEAAKNKRYWEKKREKIRIESGKIDKRQNELQEKEDAIQEKKQEIISNAKKEAKEIIDNAGSLIEKTIREIKESKADKEKTKNARKEIEKARETFNKKEKNETGKNKNSTFTVGDIVTMDDNTLQGEILQLSGAKAMVRFGSIISQTQLSRLKKDKKQVLQPIRSGHTLDNSSFNTLYRRAEFNDQIDVRGMRTIDAIDKVRRLVDDAMLFGVKEIRILHGKGEGILKEQIRAYLLSEGIAEAIHDDNPDRGGAGITVVEFAK